MNKVNILSCLAQIVARDTDGMTKPFFLVELTPFILTVRLQLFPNSVVMMARL